MSNNCLFEMEVYVCTVRKLTDMGYETLSEDVDPLILQLVVSITS